MLIVLCSLSAHFSTFTVHDHIAKVITVWSSVNPLKTLFPNLFLGHLFHTRLYMVEIVKEVSVEVREVLVGN